MSKLIIADNEIGINKDGMYCLNDLHKAAMSAGKASASHKPSEFTRSDNTKAFIEAVESEAGMPALRIVKGGVSGT